MGQSLSRKSRATLGHRQHNTAVSRRGFLKTGLGLGSSSVVMAMIQGCGGGSTAVTGGSNGLVNRSASVSFDHGVASGDPTENSVILWTRITPTALTESYEVVCNVYQGTMTARGALLKSQSFVTNAARDFTVKVDVTGLPNPGTGSYFFYEFLCNGVSSALGRTKTAPATGRAPAALNFGLVSCSSLAHGYFHAYERLAADDSLDAVVHLGDYIYEYGTGEYGNVRPYEPVKEITTLSDYRTRHGQYKKEPKLMALHARHPFITIWDDHESADNSYLDGANNHTEGAEGQWVQRKSWAQQAYDEWMPIRLPEPGNTNKIFRRLRYGSLVDWLMLDTRLFGRTLQAGTPINPLATGQENVADPSRHMIGDTQFEVLKGWLTDPTAATWKLIGNQVVFHQWTLKPGSEALSMLLKLPGVPDPLSSLVSGLTAPSGLNGDSWDGYTAERTKIMNLIAGANGGKKINNVVFLTGDVHSSWVADITPDPLNPLSYNGLNGTGAIATEFVITSVTSPGLPLPNEFGDAFRLDNPHIRYINFSDNGYAVLKVEPEKVSCVYKFVSDITKPQIAADKGSMTFTVQKDSNLVAQRFYSATLARLVPTPSP